MSAFSFAVLFAHAITVCISQAPSTTEAEDSFMEYTNVELYALIGVAVLCPICIILCCCYQKKKTSKVTKMIEGYRNMSNGNKDSTQVQMHDYNQTNQSIVNDPDNDNDNDIDNIDNDPNQPLQTDTKQSQIVPLNAVASASSDPVDNNNNNNNDDDDVAPDLQQVNSIDNNNDNDPNIVQNNIAKHHSVKASDGLNWADPDNYGRLSTFNSGDNNNNDNNDKNDDKDDDGDDTDVKISDDDDDKQSADPVVYDKDDTVVKISDDDDDDNDDSDVSNSSSSSGEPININNANFVLNVAQEQLGKQPPPSLQTIFGRKVTDDNDDDDSDDSLLKKQQQFLNNPDDDNAPDYVPTYDDKADSAVILTV